MCRLHAVRVHVKGTATAHVSIVAKICHVAHAGDAAARYCTLFLRRTQALLQLEK